METGRPMVALEKGCGRMNPFFEKQLELIKNESLPIEERMHRAAREIALTKLANVELTILKDAPGVKAGEEYLSVLSSLIDRRA
jgi:hypothetical protein